MDRLPMHRGSLFSPSAISSSHRGDYPSLLSFGNIRPSYDYYIITRSSSEVSAPWNF